MARTTLGNRQSITDRRMVQGNVGANVLATPAEYETVAAMRTRLAAFQAGTYTAAYLDLMSYNDMVYALRLADDAAGI